MDDFHAVRQGNARVAPWALCPICFERLAQMDLFGPNGKTTVMECPTEEQTDFWRPVPGAWASAQIVGNERRWAAARRKSAPAQNPSYSENEEPF
jgi:hypothetical protein